MGTPAFALTGKTVFIGEDEVRGDFVKRKIWIETDDQYPNTFEIEFNKDKTTLLNAVRIGDQVTIDINLRGRTYTAKSDNELKCFNTLNGWRLKNLSSNQPISSVQSPPIPSVANTTGTLSGAPLPGAVTQDDLPF